MKVAKEFPVQFHERWEASQGKLNAVLNAAYYEEEDDFVAAIDASIREMKELRKLAHVSEQAGGLDMSHMAYLSKGG